MRIKNNIAAMNSQRNLKKNTTSLNKNLEKLASGYQINRSADDAAGLAVSEKMRFQITGLDRAQDNAQEGINLIQTAEGALTEVHDMLDRMISLATQSANGIYTDQERGALDGEFSQLKAEIDRIGSSSNFNNIPLFQGTSNPNTGIRQVYDYTFRMDLSAKTCQLVSVAATGVNAASSSGALDYSEIPSGFKTLAETIATEYFPNAINQILNAFPALEDAVGSDTIDMKLEIGNIDGANGTLAYAQYSFYSTPGSDPINMLIKVDSSDFSDASLTNSKLEMLESTLAHELMHSVMQYTLTDEMSGRVNNGADKFPTWFIEGTAQLSGGGFTTGWNDAIAYYVTSTDTKNAANIPVLDATIANYLASYSVSDRPYGHGYLAAAYLGYLANGGGTVTGAGIAVGMDKIFEDILKNNKTLYEAVSDQTGLGPFSSMNALTGYLDSLFTNKGTTENAALVAFVRDLGIATQNGAGSVIAGDLGDGDGNIIGNGATSSPFSVVAVIGANSDGDLPESAKELQFTVGVNGDVDVINVDLFEMNAAALNLSSTNVRTDSDSRVAISNIRSAVAQISAIRGYYGAIQNRLEHTISNIGVASENLTESESVVRDTDVAEEMMKYTKNNILIQSAQAMLAQANTVPEGVLTLLR